jgi:general nucleoside transport system permease protein
MRITPRLSAVVIPVVAAAIGMSAGVLLAALLGAPPGRFLGLMLGDTLGSGYGIGQVLFRATPLIFTGLAAAIPFRAGFFNIGAEGQMAVGGFVMALVGIHLRAIPGPWLWVICVASAALAGAVWGGIAGFLKARTGAHEVIATILLNFIAAALINYFLNRFYALPETVRTAELGPGAWMPRVSDLVGAFRGSGVSAAFLFAVVAAIGCDLVLMRTSLGFAWRILAGGSRRARYARLSPARLTVLAMSFGGALAGMGGVSYILGSKHYFEEGFTGGAGFVGIAVALLARNRPAAVPATALLFGLLAQGGLAVNSIVPREIVDLLVAIVLFVFIVMDARAREGSARWLSS